jgi:hypothetical protein
LSTRPGTGGRIVGWQDDDLAMAELQVGGPTEGDRARSAVAQRPAGPPPVSPATPGLVGPPGYPQVITEASVLARAASEASASVMVEPVAGEPMVDEDDWEWTIALARARAEAPDEAAARAAPPSAPTGAKRVVTRTDVRTRPMPAMAMPAPAMKDPAASGEWPKTETIGEIDYDDPARPTRTAIRTPPVAPAPRARRTTPSTLSTSSTSKAPAAALPPVPRGPAPATVIPVPTLPTMHGSAHTNRLEPVVRTATAQIPPASMARFAKGTGEVGQRDTARGTPAMTDDTQPNLSIGDRTTPGIAMPLAARAVQLPSVKRRAAQRR